MAKETKVIVRANENLDDCLQGAADAYIAEHPELAGWDLSPEWTDDDTRETVTLTVPVDSVDGYHEDRLARAAAHIEAVELADGTWAHYADETSTWYVVDADDLESLCDYLDDEDPSISRDAYSHWCAGTTSEEMPEGWEPGGEDEPVTDTTAESETSDDMVTLETMPEHLCASHRAAGNWGTYPANGAVRERMSRSEAEWEIEHDDDGYAHIV